VVIATAIATEATLIVAAWGVDASDDTAENPGRSVHQPSGNDKQINGDRH
jgi:hypothetical protein